MSYGKMNTFIDIITTAPVKDADGFVTQGDHVIASIRAYKEDRHGNERWANMAVFSEATALFRFRKIPGTEVTTSLFIGLDKLYYAKITESEDGEETYGLPAQLAKAMKADLSIELAEAVLYADDGAAEVIKDFKSGTLSLGVDDIGVTAAQDLTGAVTDDNGVLISASENAGVPVAVGFRAMKPDGKYRYFWLYKVKFGIPATNLQTKGDSITFSTPTIEGTVMRRNKVDGMGKHPWKAEVTESGAGVSSSTITGWFTGVYEPVYSQ